MKNKDIYIDRAFFSLQDFKKSGQGKMEEMNMACSPGGFLQIAGRALIVFKRGFFGMKEIGKRDNKNEAKKDDQIENLFLTIGHFVLY